MKIIVTNLSVNADSTIADHQSYLYNIDNWESYVESYKSGLPFDIPQGLQIEDLIYDDHHLSCVMVSRITGVKTVKLAHLSDYVLVK